VPAVLPIPDKDYIKENKNALALLMGFSLYLYVCTYTFQSTEGFKIMLSPDASDYEKNLHGDGTCDFDSNSSIQKLIYLSFVPVIVFRAYGAIKYYKKDPLDFKSLSDRIEILYHGSFGMWTLTSLYLYMSISQNCRDLFVMSMINF